MIQSMTCLVWHNATCQRFMYFYRISRKMRTLYLKRTCGIILAISEDGIVYLRVSIKKNYVTFDIFVLGDEV